jgi:hypothetical protein
MKWVRVENGVVREVVPQEATEPSVAHWYGEEFAAQCVEAPDEVEQNWLYDGGAFRAPGPTLETLRSAKLAEMSAAAEAAIVAGVDVTTAYGDEHFSLSDHDQTNITNLSIVVGSGAPGYLYHADGKLCVMYAAADIMAIVTAAMRHVTFHTTYHNFIKQWALRETDLDVLEGITYGASLPEDLADGMTALMTAVNGGGS